MSDIVMTTDREALKSAILYMEKALSAFKKGLNLEIENEKINTAQKTVEKAKTAPAETKQKVEVPKKGPEKLAPSIEDIRKVFAKIMLDQVVDGLAGHVQLTGQRCLRQLRRDDRCCGCHQRIRRRTRRGRCCGGWCFARCAGWC